MDTVSAFRLWSTGSGVLADLRQDSFPAVVTAWRGNDLELADDATHFGFVHEGESRLQCGSGCFSLRPGMYFAIPGPGRVRAVDGGTGLVISRLGYRGFFQLGGPIESVGRLRYIDGCSDSLLLSPVRKGDPCLNLLHIPPGVSQTTHTHPSFRVGLIVAGQGQCITPAGATDLRPGQIFLIEAHGLHAFRTTQQSLTIIAFHPDSDFGPTHENHPMLNRTLIDGRSAAGRVPPFEKVEETRP